MFSVLKDCSSVGSKKWFTVKDMASDFHCTGQAIRYHYQKLIEKDPSLKEELKREEYGKNNGGRYLFSERFYDAIKDSLMLPDELNEINSLFKDNVLGTRLQKALRGKKGYSLSKLTQSLINDMIFIKGLISNFKETDDVDLINQVEELIDKDLESIENLLKK